MTCLFGLRPDTAYRLADGEDILDFSTLHEAFTLDVRDFGARGDGTQDDTAAIQAAILACPPQSRVLLPAGVWRVTHLFLRDHLRLELAQGATLLGSYDKAHLPVLPGMLQSWDEETEYNLGTWEGNPLPATPRCSRGCTPGRGDLWSRQGGGQRRAGHLVEGCQADQGRVPPTADVPQPLRGCNRGGG